MGADPGAGVAEERVGDPVRVERPDRDDRQAVLGGGDRSSPSDQGANAAGKLGRLVASLPAEQTTWVPWRERSSRIS